MRALILQHVAVEGPGSLAEYLGERGWEIETMALYDGAVFPEELQRYDAVIVMGGPMGVYDDAAYPFLRAEHVFLQRAIRQGVPLLGICLGSQLLAQALGARVYRNAHKEIGWYPVTLTAAGRADPLFTGVTSPCVVFQWHGDAFDVPPGAVGLAASPLCAQQAFRYGERVYGLLFHLELTPAVIQTWLETFQEELASLQGQIDPQHIMADIPQHLAAYTRTARQVFTNLVERLWEPLAAQRRAEAGR
ncbi:MAG: type 1 glutamine amidotransferase [Candidatus Tectimicrobiota bacterium]